MDLPIPSTPCHVDVAGRRITYDANGPGTLVLLLHGFPQTRLAWRSVVPLLSDRYRVVCPDLPGYGMSDRLGEGPEAFDKACVASHLVDFMAALGHDRFAIVGHDRGALVAFRAALDHPDVVSHLGVLDVIPTADNWAALTGVGGVFAFHLYLLAQPSDLPERLIGADPDTFFGHFLDGWTVVSGAVPHDVREQYLAAFRSPAAIRAVCDDYRASAFIDGIRDVENQARGRTLSMPTFAAWQDSGDYDLPFDPHPIWASWAPDLKTAVASCGHFLPEEAPELVASNIRMLLER
ncbi:alpha/beta hydrolase [Tsukamurella sp. M9C]|uniref:alpha/beta fold hydrolase n=1 Tax=Tsukamurella sp. M9C TaxID=2877520 RepID=UPI001CCFA040|nr:alpha/beta hydrolase [Tsukamurella sp. M9C]MCA0158914.1 alpha/beta hydrolase [Tsukamurella sp. M9C]